MKRSRKALSMKMLLVLTVTSAVVIVVIGALLIFLNAYRQSVVNNAKISSRQSVEQVSNTVENYIDDINEIMVILEQELVGQTDREQFFETFFSIKSDVVAVTTYDAAGKMVSCFSGNQELLEEPETNLSFDAGWMAEYENGYISSPHVVTIFQEYYPWVVTLVTSMQTEYGECWAALDFRFSNISEYINGVGIGEHGYCYLMDEEGKIIYHPQQQLIYFGLKEENTAALVDLEDGEYVQGNTIYTLQKLQHHDWRVVGVSFVDEVVEASFAEITRILIVCVWVVLVIAVICAWILSAVMSRPLQILSKEMQRFEKEADRFVYHSVRGTLEVNSLSDSFGHMVGKIQRLVETIRKEEINLRKTELRALQAQINPHFLYNTLDSISWMCEQKRTVEAVEMVNALARLFRISISHGQEFIPIRNELAHAENYLKIQKHRYKDQFRYEFDVEENCLDYFCNKITLQPIIENAINHGINGLVEEGRICIHIREEGQDILFEVRDNGVGIDQEKIHEILSEENGSCTGIGIKNVNDRLRIYFGNQYGITINSALDEGTTVIIRMPKILEGAEYETK